MSIRRLSWGVAINVVANLIAAGIIYLGARALGGVPLWVLVLGSATVASVSGVVLGRWLVGQGRSVLGNAVVATASAVGVGVGVYCYCYGPMTGPQSMWWMTFACIGVAAAFAAAMATWDERNQRKIAGQAAAR